jgi:hypothetical protein
MSCDAVALLASLWLAAAPAAPAPQAQPPASVGQEPLFAEIAARAGALKAEVDAFRGQPASVTPDFKLRIEQLAAMDMQGHRTLAARNLDGDLKCILRGIAEDLPLKLQALEAATDPAARDAAVRDLAYLLNDNVEVITAPAQAPI